MSSTLKQNHVFNETTVLYWPQFQNSAFRSDRRGCAGRGSSSRDRRRRPSDRRRVRSERAPLPNEPEIIKSSN